MTDTKEFRTKTLNIPRTNLHKDGFWEIAVDIGYSGTKLFSPNKVACFPSFATKVIGRRLEVNQEDDKGECILYRNESGEIWIVGKFAQDMSSVRNPNSNSMSIYGRNRYFSPMFKVILETSLALACEPNKFGAPEPNSRYIVQTGLPNSFLRSDSMDMKEVFSGRHRFAVKRGNSGWREYDISINEDDVLVMEQPMGTLLSVVTGNDGIPIPEAGTYYGSRILIMDPGFGTLDCFTFDRQKIEGEETFDDLGMKQILSNVSEEIYKHFRTDIPVPSLQKFLEKGYVSSYDRATETEQKHEIADIVEEASEKVAMDALAKIKEVYDSLREYDYLVVTGGTGEAWYDIISKNLAGREVKVMKGNANDDLPCIFSNVRGYYLYLSHRTARL